MCATQRNLARETGEHAFLGPSRPRPPSGSPVNSLNADSAHPGAFPVRSLERYGRTRARRDAEPCGAPTARHPDSRAPRSGGVDLAAGQSSRVAPGRRSADGPVRPRPRPMPASRPPLGPHSPRYWPRPLRPRPSGTVTPNPLLFHLGPRPVPLRPRPLFRPRPKSHGRRFLALLAGPDVRTDSGPRPPPGSGEGERALCPCCRRPLCVRRGHAAQLPVCGGRAALPAAAGAGHGPAPRAARGGRGARATVLRARGPSAALHAAV